MEVAAMTIGIRKTETFRYTECFGRTYFRLRERTRIRPAGTESITIICFLANAAFP